MNNFIQFKKQRDLGEVLTDAFKFIRVNGKELFGLIIRIAGPALLLVVISFVYYSNATVMDLDQIAVYGDSNVFTGGVVISILVLILAALAFYALLYGTIIHYIKSYVKNNGAPNIEEVKSGVKTNFWSLVGLSLLVGLMTGLGLIFCFIPGIYLGTVLATTYAIHVLERKEVADAISYSFELIKGEWWISFLTYLVIFILFYILIIVFQIPQYIYFFAKSMAVSEDFSTGSIYNSFDWIYISLNALAVIAQYLSHGFIVICTVLVYYNLNEKKNFSGTLEQIESIGKE